MDKIEVRKVTSCDMEELQAIARQTFFETFADENSKCDMQKYSDEKFSLDKLKEESMIPASEFYFASIHNRVIGYLKLNFREAQTELKDLEALEIERIYVLKEFHGQKIGQILYDTALQSANRSKVSYVWLGVWKNNLRAINFYKKNGFVAFGIHIFKLGDDEQTDIMMKFSIK